MDFIRSDNDEPAGDLFGLAQTVATLTGGIVSIEDSSYRVLAYSQSTDEADELRRLTILGRQGPEAYMRLLREWGIYQRLRDGNAVVRVAERPDLGIRERLVVGVHAGPQFLGTIWVQEGREPLRSPAERELAGAAVLAARYLVHERAEPSSAARRRADLLRRLLDGQEDLAVQLGVDPASRCAVVALEPGTGETPDPTLAELWQTRLVALVALHSATFRRAAAVTVIGTRVYVLLPDLEAEPAGALALVREITASASASLGVPVRAALGRAVNGVGGLAHSRREADRVLSAHTGPGLATLDDVRGEVLLGEALGLLTAGQWSGDERLGTLSAEVLAGLRAYLDAFGEVGAAASALHVHPNTVRYRVRQAVRLAGLNLTDPRERLVVMLQLRLLDGPRA
ncbi:MAG: PucR family transcriptional regulator [Actinomycetia bacterium]|nr:PucR family transcriptional regulator [Actinomycetes bacterium]